MALPPHCVRNGGLGIIDQAAGRELVRPGALGQAGCVSQRQCCELTWKGAGRGQAHATYRERRVEEQKGRHRLGSPVARVDEQPRSSHSGVCRVRGPCAEEVPPEAEPEEQAAAGGRPRGGLDI